MARLATKLYIRCHNSGFNNRYHQDDCRNPHKPKDIVVHGLILPQALEDEHQLDEDDRKGNKADKKNTLRGLTMPRLGGNLAWNRIGLDRVHPGATHGVSTTPSNIN